MCHTLRLLHPLICYTSYITLSHLQVQELATQGWDSASVIKGLTGLTPRQHHTLQQQSHKSHASLLSSGQPNSSALGAKSLTSRPLSHQLPGSHGGDAGAGSHGPHGSQGPGLFSVALFKSDQHGHGGISEGAGKGGAGQGPGHTSKPAISHIAARLHWLHCHGLWVSWMGRQVTSNISLLLLLLLGSLSESVCRSQTH
jgi:hypothetical protein